MTELNAMQFLQETHFKPNLNLIPEEQRVSIKEINRQSVFFRAKLQLLLQYEDYSNKHFFSPPEPDEIGMESLQELYAQRKFPAASCIIAEPYLPESIIEDLLAKNYEQVYKFDLRDPAGLQEFSKSATISEITKKLRSKKTKTLVVVRGIEQLENLSAKQRYDILYYLRSLEDQIGDNSNLITTVGAGRKLPSFTCDSVQSPYGYKSAKFNFTQNFSWEFAVDPATKEIPDLKWLDSPRSDINEVYGTRRRAQYQRIIDQVKNGENVTFLGLRRGGKTSLVHCLSEQLGEDENYLVQPIHDISEIGDFLAENYFADLSENKKVEVKETPLNKIAPLLLNLAKTYQLSGKIIVFTTDELLDRETGWDNDPIRRVHFFDFMKDIRELKLGVSVLNVSVPWLFGKLMRSVAEHPENVRGAEKSAFAVEEIGLLENSEAYELLDHLASVAGLEFKSAQDKANFIQEGVEMCNGQVIALNYYVKAFAGGHEDTKHIYQTIAATLSRLFKIYVGAMSQPQRLLFTALCLRKRGEMLVSGANLPLNEIYSLERRGFVTTENLNIDRSELLLKLKAPAFRQVIAGLFDQLSANLTTNEKLVDLYMRSNGISEDVIELSNAFLFEYEVSAEEYEAYQRAYIVKKTCQDEIKEAFIEAGLRGMVDVNQVFVEEDQKMGGFVVY